MTDDVSSYRQKPDVHLDLSRDDETILRIGPFRVYISPLVEGWVVVGRLCARFLHWTFDESIGEC